MQNDIFLLEEAVAIPNTISFSIPSIEVKYKYKYICQCKGDGSFTSKRAAEVEQDIRKIIKKLQSIKDPVYKAAANSLVVFWNNVLAGKNTASYYLFKKYTTLNKAKFSADPGAKELEKIKWDEAISIIPVVSNLRKKTVSSTRQVGSVNRDSKTGQYVSTYFMGGQAACSRGWQEAVGKMQLAVKNKLATTSQASISNQVSQAQTPASTQLAAASQQASDNLQSQNPQPPVTPQNISTSGLNTGQSGAVAVFNVAYDQY